MNTPIVYKQGWNDERKLLLKLAEIMQNARYIQKRGKNKFHNYNYVTEADVNEKIGDMLAERKVVFIPNLVSSDMRETTTKSGNIEYIVKARMEFTFMDAETGESVTANMEGEGQDNGDKAIYKSISGTQKYILLKFFMLASGDDPEGDETVDQRNAVKDLPMIGSKEEAAEIGAKKLAEAKEKEAAKAKAKATVEPLTPESLQKEIFGIINKKKMSFPDLNEFASATLNRKISFFKKDVVSETDLRIVKAALNGEVFTEEEAVELSPDHPDYLPF